MTSEHILSQNGNLIHIGWKSYNQIKKKAMEQEFSWSGLLLSLSIAFFIVIASALVLNIFYKGVEESSQHKNFLNQKIYNLEPSGNNLERNSIDSFLV